MDAALTKYLQEQLDCQLFGFVLPFLGKKQARKEYAQWKF